MNLLNSYRILSFLEGASYILLLFIGVPVKYFVGNPILDKALGMPHGILFIAYSIFTIYLCWRISWGIKGMLIFLIAGLLPFGTFYTVRKYV